MAIKQQWVRWFWGWGREFYGSPKAENDIKVKDASHEGFLAVIKYIYNKKLRMIFFAFLYYLADKYNFELKPAEDAKENVLGVGLLAQKNVLHQQLLEGICDAAARFVKKAKSAVDDLCADGNEDHAEVVFMIIYRSSTNKQQGVKVQHTVVRLPPGQSWISLMSEK